MRLPVRLVLPALAALALGACTDAATAPAVQPVDAPSSALAAAPAGGSYLVRFKGNGVPRDFAATVAGLGGRIVFAHAATGIAAVAGLDDASADRLAARSEISAVAADGYTELEPSGELMTADATPASPTNPAASFFYPYQWNMRAIGAPAAWSAGQLGSAAVKVAILDTGLDYLHPDLYGRVDLQLSRSFLPAEDARVQATFPGAHPVADLHFHGTHTGATVASNGLAAAGVTSRTTLVGLKVCEPGTAANGWLGACPTSAVLAALLYAADAGVDVANLSLGGGSIRRLLSARGGNAPSFIAILNGVMNYVSRQGMTVVVASGNSAMDLDHHLVPDGEGNSVHVPGLYGTYCDVPSVICVSATGPTNAAIVGGQIVFTEPDAFAAYSNFGRSAISVAAPGGNAFPVYAACSGFTIVTQILGCRDRIYIPSTGQWQASALGVNGTSMAAPHVSAVAALLVPVLGRNPAQIRARIQQTADDLGQPGRDPYYGSGRLNVARALGL